MQVGEKAGDGVGGTKRERLRPSARLSRTFVGRYCRGRSGGGGDRTGTGLLRRRTGLAEEDVRRSIDGDPRKGAVYCLHVLCRRLYAGCTARMALVTVLHVCVRARKKNRAREWTETLRGIGRRRTI